MHAPIQPELRDRLQRHVERLAGEIGERNIFQSAALDAARDYIRSEWEVQGYSVTLQWYEAQGQRCANIEVAAPGTVQPQKILVIGAHYDSVRGSPGADDNASGIATLLELSRCFAFRPAELTLRFVAFVNEEMPFFLTGRQGSMVYARSCRRRGDSILAMISLECLGYYRQEKRSQKYPPFFRFFYPDRGNFVALVSDFRSRPAMRALARTFRACSDFPLEHVATFRWIPGVALSDHLSFWRMGYRAVMVTDTAFYRNPFYHTRRDAPGTLDYAALARLTEGLQGTLEVMARADSANLPKPRSYPDLEATREGHDAGSS